MEKKVFVLFQHKQVGSLSKSTGYIGAIFPSQKLYLGKRSRALQSPVQPHAPKSAGHCLAGKQLCSKGPGVVVDAKLNLSRPGAFMVNSGWQYPRLC